MRTSMLMEINLGDQNGGARQVVNGGGGGGRRRSSKGSNELTHKKNKQPQRGMGVEQLERVLRLQERCKKMPQVPSSIHPLPLPSFNSVPNVAVQFRPHAPPPTPAMMFHGVGMHGANLFSTDHVMDPSVIGSGNAGHVLHFENSKELSSIPSYVKCVSDGCGVCHKKKRINSGSNACWANQFRDLSGNSAVMEMIDARKTRRSSGQVAELMTVHRNGGGALPEYEFFPGKGGGGTEEYKELMKMGTTTTTWCGSGTSVGGGVIIGLRGGEGSCVTAITGSEEGSVSSLDLTLKLSY